MSDPQSPEASPVETIEADDSDKSQQNAGSWSLVDTGAIDKGAADAGTGRHRGDSADESAADGAAGSSGRHASYTVRPGDTLATIADSFDVDGGWSALYAENEQAIGADPNHIVVGQTLDVPGE